MSNVPSRGTSSVFISFSSRQTNVIKDKVRITIERIRFHAENLTSVRSKDVSKLDSSKLTLEENEELLDGLKLLFDESDYDEQIRLLTIAPSSWGRSKIEAFFSCNNYQARKSLVIRDSQGILQRSIDSRGNPPLDKQIAQGIVHDCWRSIRPFCEQLGSKQPQRHGQRNNILLIETSMGENKNSARRLRLCIP
jgi:hypothetical protein